jgi:hypothetical protein
VRGSTLGPLPTKATRVPSPTAQSGKPIDLVLHIGSTKTGSSSIQYFLGDNRERLADLGHLYPQTAERTRLNRVGLLIKSDADLEDTPLYRRQKQSDPAAFKRDFRGKLIREITESGLSRVLLSDEVLYHHPDPPALGRLRRLTDELATSLRLVVYLRRQDDHLISNYQQQVKDGAEIRRIDEFVHQDTLFRYDYAARLRTWERILEPDEFVVRRYEKDSFVDGSLVQDFLHAAEMDVRVEDLAQVPQHNESLDAESVEFLRLFNLYRVESEGSPPGWSWRQRREVVARLAEASAGPLLTLPGQVLDDFLAQWEGGNRAVAQRYLSDAGRELFRMPRRTEHTTTEQRLDPVRLDHYLRMLGVPEQMHEPLRRLVDREAKAVGASVRRTRPNTRIRSRVVGGTARFLRRGRYSAAEAGATERA